MQPFVQKLYAFPFGAHVHLLVISNDRDMTFFCVCAARNCPFNAVNPVSIGRFVQKLYAFQFGAHVHVLVF